MRTILSLGLIAAFTLAFAHAAPRPSTTDEVATAADEAAIRAIIAAERDGHPDPHIARNMDWENAFGVRFTDAANRARLLHYVATKLQAHATAETLETRIAVLDPAMAVADEYWHVAGQIDQATGKPGADRWGRTSFILRKQNGDWSLVAERIADLRIPYYRHFTTLPQPVPVPSTILASYAGRYVTDTGKADSRVTVEGDHLLVQADGAQGIGIATSQNDFLVFMPGNLERYYTLHFAPGGTALTWSARGGKKSGQAVKSP